MRNIKKENLSLLTDAMNIVKIHFSRSENVTELSKFLCLNLGNFRNKGDQKRNSALPFKFSGVSEHAKNM